jgi:hypothetical protein
MPFSQCSVDNWPLAEALRNCMFTIPGFRLATTKFVGRYSDVDQPINFAKTQNMFLSYKQVE